MGFHLPFFPVYAAETLADGRFQGWNLEERGAWFTLLLANWNDGDIPSSQTVLARLLGCGPSDMARIWSAIGDRFVEVPDKPGRLWSPRLEEERENALKLSRTRARAGKEGARARWDKEKKSDGKRMRLPEQTHGKGNADAMRSQCPQQSPSQPPSPSQNSSASGLPNLSSLVEASYPGFWAVYTAAQSFCPGISIPKSKEARDSLEADVARLTVPVAVEECRRVAAKYPEPIGNMAFFVDALHKAGRGSAKGPQPVSRDYSKTLAET